jgi:hypothetical protein
MMDFLTFLSAVLHPHVCTVLLIEASCPKLRGLIEYMIPDDSCAMCFFLPHVTKT